MTLREMRLTREGWKCVPDGGRDGMATSIVDTKRVHREESVEDRGLREGRWEQEGR